MGLIKTLKSLWRAPVTSSFLGVDLKMNEDDLGSTLNFNSSESLSWFWLSISLTLPRRKDALCGLG